MAACVGLLVWLASGVIEVPLDGRAIYERFGAPVSVLHAGLHAGLPLPFGAAHALEYGAIHDISLAPHPAASPIDAEDRVMPTQNPVSGGVALLVAGEAARREFVQSLSAGVRILYRTGLTDADALRAAYATADPEALVRALSGQVVAEYFAARTPDSWLGAGWNAMEHALRNRLQAALDRHATGLEVIGVLIEAISPPAGAAGATDAMRAADITVRTSTALAHGEAAASAAHSRQAAYDITSAAHAIAAETVALARAEVVRFDADRGAAHAGGQVFLTERYFAALDAALAHAPKTIIDHRLNWPEAPVLDLRPFAAAAGSTLDKGAP